MDITINDGRQVKTPALPFSINGERLQSAAILPSLASIPKRS